MGAQTSPKNRRIPPNMMRAKAAVMAEGGVVRQLDAAQRQAWVDALKPVWEKFEGDVGQDLIDAAQAIN